MVDKKPETTQRLRTTHPLAKGLRSCLLFNEGFGAYATDALDGSLRRLEWTNHGGATPGSNSWVSADFPYTTAMRVTIGGYGLGTEDDAFMRLGVRPQTTSHTFIIFARLNDAVNSNTNDAIVSSGIAGAGRIGLMHGAPATLNIKYSKGGAEIGTGYTAINWNHIACVVRGPTGYIYINNGTPSTGAVGATQSDGHQLALWAREFGTIGSGYTDGSNTDIAYFAYWDRALSPQEIRRHYIAPFEMFDAPRRIFLMPNLGKAAVAVDGYQQFGVLTKDFNRTRYAAQKQRDATFAKWR